MNRQLIRPAAGMVFHRLSRRLIVISLFAVTFPMRTLADSALLEGLKATIVSRWQFQKHFPLALDAFTHRLNEGDARALGEQLRGPDLDTLRASDAAWRHLALGLAAERLAHESGGADFQRAENAARGNIPLNFEMARILETGGLNSNARSFQKESERSLMEQGYARAPELAKLELWRVRNQLSRGQFQPARSALEEAGRLDPFCPWAPWLGLEIKLRETPPWGWNPGLAWTAALGTFHQLRYYDTQHLFVLNVLRALRWGMGIFGITCLAALCIRYFFRMAHPLAEKLPQVVELRLRYLAVGVIPLSLWVGGGGYIVLGLIATALLWKHSSRDERGLLKAILTGLLALPALLLVENSLCRHLDSAGGLGLYHKAFGSGYDKALDQKADAYRAANHQDDLYRVMALSLLAKKQGNYLKAGEHASRALTLAPGNPLALAAAGNLSLLSFDFPKASSFYQKAGAAAPGMTEVWFNASQAALYANKSDLHKRYLEQAAALDADLVTQFLKANDEHFGSIPPNRKVMDVMLRPAGAWVSALNAFADFEFAALPVRTGLMEVPASWLLAAVLLTAAAIFVRFRRYSQNLHGRDLFECKICGRVMCRTCRKGVHCQQCFKTVAGVHESRVRAELILKLKAKAAAVPRWIGWSLNLLFPGAGALYLGSTQLMRPLLISLAFGVGVAAGDLFMEYPAFVLGPLRWLAWIPLVLLYGFFWTAQLVRSRRGFGAQTPAAAAREKAMA